MARKKSFGKKRRGNRKGRKSLGRIAKGISTLVKQNGETWINKVPAKTYTFKRTMINEFNIVNTVLGDIPYDFLFEPATHIPNWSEYAAMFKSYKILKAKYLFTAIELPPDNMVQPTMLIAKWNDSVDTGNVVNDFQEYSRVMKKEFSHESRTTEFTVVPFALDEFFESALTTGYGKVPGNKQWFEISSDTINFYSIHVLMVGFPASSTNNTSIRVDVEYTVTFKDLQ